MLQRKAIADAAAVGFRDCHAVFDALGVELRSTPAGYLPTRSSLDRWQRRRLYPAACDWIVDAGFAFVEYIVPDGYGSIPKAERTGCHVDDLPEIVAYKAAVDLARQQAEWDAAVPSAIAARERKGL